MGTQPVRVAIDLETTGLLPEQDAVIEVGALKFAGDDILDTFESFVALPPGVSLPYRVRRLTGINPAQLRGAPAFFDLVPRLRTFLGDLPLVGHSVPFDAAFLRRAGLARHNPLVDTYELASTLLPDLPSYTLASVGSALDVSNPTHHRALADAQLARDVFLALLARLDTLDTTTLEALDRLAAPPDWTPGYFVRSTLRARQKPARAASAGFGGLGGGTLGDQLAAKLGIDPAALSLAIAGPARTATPLRGDHSDAGVTQSAPSGSDLARIHPSLAQALDECLTRGGALAVEIAPEDADVEACLASVLRWVSAQDERVLISVADGESVARMERDVLPRVRLRAGPAAQGISVAPWSGQKSYLCLHRWYGAARLSRNGYLSRDLARGLARLTVWAAQTSTGARGEIALTGQESAAWDLVRAGAEFTDSNDTCTYRRDGYCYVARAEEAARTARVVLTTHAALAARLTGADTLLPDIARVLVLDAHLLEEEMRRAAGFTIERQELLATLATLAETELDGARVGLLHLAAQADTRGKPASGREQTWFAHVERARRATETLFQELRGLLAESQRDSGRTPTNNDQPEQRTLRLDAHTRRLARWSIVVRAWEDLAARLEAVIRFAREAARGSVSAHGNGPISSDGVATDLLGICRRLELVRTHGGTLFGASGDDNRVAWLRVPYAASGPNTAPTPWRQGGPGRRPTPDQSGSHAQPRAEKPDAPGAERAEARAPDAEVVALAGDENGGDSGETPVVHSAPVQVGALLAPLVAPERSLLLSSPALAVAGDFTYVRGSLGLPDSLRTLSFANDRSNQTLLCMPTDVPEPNAAQYQRHLDDALARFAVALGGRLVAIFPSHAALRAGAQGIRRKLERQDILVLAQGQDGSARQLWQTFRNEPRVVLLGAGAFWEGASQSDQPPACVVVTRVPFPAMSDPLLAARADTWSDQQNQFVVPHAALRLRQALGGLAWSHRQRNAVVLFDRRLQTRVYGPTILGTLPPCTAYQEPVERIAERMVEWIDEG
ncbi:MAG TPA: exonuclease domain-containing protein [Ktedonobacterales bacterium]|nr:exonuclease domain-containing protein [Ktedonobacterales bacterium]